MSQSASEIISIECMRIAITVRHTVEPLHNGQPGDKKEVRGRDVVVMGGMGVTFPGIFGGGDQNLVFIYCWLYILKMDTVGK